MVAIRYLAFSLASLTKQLDWTWNYLTLCLERICFRILGGGGDRVGIRFAAVAFNGRVLETGGHHSSGMPDDYYLKHLDCDRVAPADWIVC